MSQYGGYYDIPLITQELVIGTNGIGNGSGYCFPFAQNMLYTLEKNDSELLKELIHFTSSYNNCTHNYYTERNKIEIYTNSYKNTVQYRQVLYLSKYKSKTDNKVKNTNIYLHFSTLAQVLSDPFLLADMLYRNKNIGFSLNYKYVEQILSVTKKYMPKLYEKNPKKYRQSKIYHNFYASMRV